MPPKKVKEAPAAIPVKRDALKGKSVIITGDIEGQTRDSANQILINAGATIEKSLNKKVQLVVLGEKAGPKKLEKIEQLGLETREWDDLIEEIKGEGGEEAGAGEDEEDVDDEMDEDEEEEEEEVEEKPKPAKGKAKANTKAKAAPVAAPKASAAAPKAPTGGSVDLAGKTVIITGAVAGHDRKSAGAILEKAGAKIAKSLNKSVELVIIGNNPGPDKLAKIEDLGIETITWNEVAGELGVEVAPEKPAANVETGDPPSSIEDTTVIITGTIDGHTRGAAEKMLQSAGAKIAKSLNNSVQLVVLGAKPGPDKLHKISEMGIDTCSFEALVAKLGIEAEEQPPKKKARKG